jgi:hypothetical protein
MPGCFGVVCFIIPYGNSDRNRSGADIDRLLRQEVHDITTVAAPILAFTKKIPDRRTPVGVQDAECVGLSSAQSYSQYLLFKLIELNFATPSSVSWIFTDSKNIESHVYSNNRHSNPRIHSQLAALRENVQRGVFRRGHIAGKHNPADCLTKSASFNSEKVLLDTLSGRLTIPVETTVDIVQS